MPRQTDLQQAQAAQIHTREWNCWQRPRTRSEAPRLPRNHVSLLANNCRPLRSRTIPPDLAQSKFQSCHSGPQQSIALDTLDQTAAEH